MKIIFKKHINGLILSDLKKNGYINTPYDFTTMSRYLRKSIFRNYIRLERENLTMDIKEYYNIIILKKENDEVYREYWYSKIYDWIK